MKTLFPTQPALEPTMEAALARIGDGGGLTEDESGTLSLSTPIVSTQDGPRMSGVSNIPAHRKAAPFRKGGKRRKAVLAKDALRKSKASKSDYSNVDLAFRPDEKRDKYGKWTALSGSLTALKPGDKVSFSDSHGGNAQTYVSIKDGQFRHDDGIKVGPNTASTRHGLELDLKAKAHLAKGGRVQVFRRRHLGNLALTAESQRDIDLGFSPSEPRGTDGRWIRAAMRASTQRERNAIRSGHMADVQSGHTSNEEHSKVLGVLDAADKAAQGHATMDHRLFAKREAAKGYAKSGPTWTPEKGARGPAEAKYLKARNMLAKAVLSQNDKAIKKYQGKVAKAKFKFDQEKNARAAIARATAIYTSPASIAATNGSTGLRSMNFANEDAQG